MAEKISPLAGKPAPASLLVDVARLIAAYYGEKPDPAIAAQTQRVIRLRDGEIEVAA